MDTEEPEQHPTIAGRALRALRTTRAPADAPPADAPLAEEPAPVVEDAEPLADDAEPVVADAEPVVADTEPAAEPVSLVKPPRSKTASRSRNNGLLIGAIVILALAMVFAGVAAVVYFTRTDSSTTKAAQARDDALVAARIDIATLNTLDYHNVQPGLQKWLAVSTGSFHDQLAQETKSVASAIAKAKISTTGRVIAAAVTDLNSARTSALVIASLDTVKTPAGGTSAVDRNRYRATMQLVDGVWKIADLSIVAVGLS